MGAISKIQRDGISLRMLYTWLIVIAIVVSALMIYSTFHLSSSFSNLSDAVNRHMELHRAANDLMEASDYLTENVQRFSVTANTVYMDNYFNEAQNSKRREKAIKKMLDLNSNLQVLNSMHTALKASQDLMLQEYYSMKLVIDAEGYADYPEILRNIVLKDEDRTLTRDQKRKLATEILFNEEYYSMKESIRKNMKTSINEIEKATLSAESKLSQKHLFELHTVRTVIIIETICIIFMIWLTSQIGIKPILRAAERIRNDSPIPVTGSNEFRYLAINYNKMYDIYRKSVERLNYKASHDELTGAYNRAGYDLLLSSIDLKTTYMLLFDVDNFKGINDTYGHETGDKILKKIVSTLNRNFRSDDYVCRLGGDEFVVFMVHADENRLELIKTKITNINDQLSETADGLPQTSVSVGIVHGTKVQNRQDMYKMSDEALYKTKRNGKHGYSFS